MPAGGLVEAERAIKEPEKLAAIRAGARIEDLVAVREDGVDVLTSTTCGPRVVA